MNKIEPIIIDILSIRNDRQNKNNLLAIKSIEEGNLTQNINIKEYKRVLDELHNINKTEKDLLEDCKNNIITKYILAGRISINSSRQGSKDENLQLEICNMTFSKCGIYIKKLSSSSFRPTKKGEIINNKIKSKECLKSFDAIFNGKINGWIFAKIVIGNGGHQDNVFEEANIFCDWVSIYGNKKELFIVLIDTNLIDKYNQIIDKYKEIPNLLVGNHIKVQQYIIDNYYSIEDNK
jgi:hypothetical protein